MRIDITHKGVLAGGPARPHCPLADGAGDEDENIFHVEFDPREDSLAEVVPRSIAAISDQSPLELDPLGGCVDVDRLDAIAKEHSNRRIEGGEISFTYEGFEITVDVSGHLWIERL